MTATGGVRMQRLMTSGKINGIRGGQTLDLYNQATIPRECCTITTRIEHSNHYWYFNIKKMTDNDRPNPNAVIYTAKNGNRYEIAIRKYTPTDCFRLMGVRDEDIAKLLTTHKVIRKGEEIEEQIISNSKLYQLAGNSIVTNCMTAIFDKLFYPDGKPQCTKDGQLLLF